MAKTQAPRIRLPFQRTSADPAAGRGAAPDAAAGGPEPEPEGAGGDGGAQQASPVRGEPVFYVVVGSVLAAYTVVAFGMDWATAAGRVGPGLFPRIIGVLGVAACTVGALHSMRGRMRAARSEPEAAPAADHAGGGGEPAASTASGSEAGGAPDARRHPWTVVALCAILALFVTVLVPVGAVVTGALALTAALLLCDRSHPVRSVLLGTAFPVVLYAVFVLGLNAPLPSGILPLL
ncbi:hypothetical protein LP52_06085 [Streptomonospora alba]|uniref:DUF1468 domain-containing protein n=1 Tax=Streptomonospora alba TaxID=183763 RepID=A0A0C2JEJ5_9ACTN|nr:tripartite tricarboxylate transporter TctB family protein [Streptomonospora alba]KIH99766.1 hypothetical protein LP52_06085 [Streptomonospora alba]